jgi:hypothetical protein
MFSIVIILKNGSSILPKFNVFSDREIEDFLQLLKEKG